MQVVIEEYEFGPSGAIASSPRRSAAPPGVSKNAMACAPAGRLQSSERKYLGDGLHAPLWGTAESIPLTPGGAPLRRGLLANALLARKETSSHVVNVIYLHHHSVGHSCREWPFSRRRQSHFRQKWPTISIHIKCNEALMPDRKSKCFDFFRWPG